MKIHRTISMDVAPEQASGSISNALYYLESEAETIGLKRLATLIRLAALEADDIAVETIKEIRQ